MAPFTITGICFPNLTLRTLSLSFLFWLLLYPPHLSFPLLLAVNFRFWEASRETLLISEWRMPFLTCWHHVFPLTFANDPIFRKLIHRQHLLIYRAPTIDVVYPEEFERMVGVAQNVVCTSTLLGREGERCQELQGIPRHWNGRWFTESFCD